MRSLNVPSSSRVKPQRFFGPGWRAAAVVLFAALPSIALLQAAEGDFRAAHHQRATVYHSPQSPGFTSWCGAWIMPDRSLMVCFTQATGPVDGRRRAPEEISQRLNWPPAGQPGYDMTGLDLKNVHLRSHDGGQTWKQVSADSFESCMNGVTGEAQTALADGTVVRGVFGFYLPYNPELPQTGFLQRSTDGTLTWGEPLVPLDPARFMCWPRRLRVLRDGRLLMASGVVAAAAGSQTREAFSRQVVPMLLVSADQGQSWQGPIPAVPDDQRDGWTEEFDVAELPSGDLLAVYRRAQDANRWQGLLRKSDAAWIPGNAAPCALAHSGQPELLAIREGGILHVATTGLHLTTDAGLNWQPLELPPAAYYPRAVQAADGRIHVFGHIGGDDAYGKVDQSIVMDTFRVIRGDDDAGQELSAVARSEPPEGEVSPEGVAYLERLRKNTPFGANEFDLDGLRAGMGTRLHPSVEGVELIPVKAGEIPCEWVMAPGADPDLRLLYLHGGGFVSGSGGRYLPLAAHVSKAASCAVLMADYRLAPEHRFPAGLEDCVAAHEWMAANGPRGPAPARATFVAGDSAGGNLTLATLLLLRDRRLPSPAAGVAISPVTDLTLASPSLQTVADPIISSKSMPVFRDHYLGGQDPRNPLASPLFGDFRGLPPLLIQVGEHEMLRDDGIRAAHRARRDGVAVQLEVWKGMFHVFQSHEPLLPEARQAVDHIAAFMRGALKREQ